MLSNPFFRANASRLATNNLIKTSKFSFNGIITNLEKTVSTINQVVPLYNQVKPLISNSKTIINAFKSTTNNKTKHSNEKRDITPSIIEAKITTSTQNKQQEYSDDIFINNTTPNKPFFI